MNVKNYFDSAHDFLFVEDFEIACKVGITAEERAFPQTLRLTLKLYLPLEQAGDSDDLHQSVDYAKIIDTLKNHLPKKEFSLIESIGQIAAKLILKEDRVDAVEVEIRKKGFTGIGAVGAHIFRRKK